MLDGQVDGAGTGEARRAPPAPPTGRRAESDQSQVPLDAFTETPKKRKGRALRDGTPGQKLLDAFCVAYRERFGIAYMPSWARDLKLAKEMATSYPLELIPGMVKLYLADKDPYVAKEGFPFSLFRHRVNTYAFQARRTVSGRSGLRSGSIAVGTRTTPTETATERIWTEWNGTEWVEHREPKPKAEKPKVIMDEGDEFE